VFQPKWLGGYTAIVLDIDYDSSFVWEALDFLFLKLEARSLALTSQSREAGDRYRAVFCGSAFGNRCCEWRLDRDEYLRAVRPVRDDRVVQIPPPLSSKERKAIKAAMR
jgi:hypothetical protein